MVRDWFAVNSSVARKEYIVLQLKCTYALILSCIAFGTWPNDAIGFSRYLAEKFIDPRRLRLVSVLSPLQLFWNQHYFIQPTTTTLGQESFCLLGLHCNAALWVDIAVLIRFKFPLHTGCCADWALVATGSGYASALNYIHWTLGLIVRYLLIFLWFLQTHQYYWRRVPSAIESRRSLLANNNCWWMPCHWMMIPWKNWLWIPVANLVGNECDSIIRRRSVANSYNIDALVVLFCPDHVPG